MRIRTLLEEQGTPGWETLDYLVDISWAENAPTITITNWNQSTCYANTSASSSNLLHKDQDIPLKLETVVMDLHSYGYTNTVVLTDNLGAEHPFSHYSSSSVGKQYEAVASNYGAEYFNKVQLSASGYNLKGTKISANQLGWKEEDWGSDYDAEIEYLQSTGTQYINTRFIPDNTCGMYIRANMVTKYSDEIAVGVRQISGDYRWWINFAGNSEKIEISWNTWNGYGSLSPNNWYEVTNNYLNSRIGTINGITYRTSYPTLAATFTRPAFIFGANNVGSFSNPFYGKISNVKLSRGTEVAMDFIPVRKGQVGFLYDKVSGKLFGNSGTGSFILGPDK